MTGSNASMTPPKPKVLIIFPKYEPNADSHFPYWYKFFGAAKKDLDLAFIYENQHSRLTRFLLILKYVRLGYRHIYIHYGYLSVYIAYLISKIFHLKSYYWDCEFYTQKPSNLLLNLALKFCDVLVTGSPLIGEQYKKIFKLGPKDIRIVPNYVEESKISNFKIQISNSSINILFVHHLSPRKGSRDLPEIIRLTLEKIPTAHFHIIGSGPDLNNFKLNHAVTVYGSLPHRDVVNFFKKCDYFIMPSRSEGFPRVILEAMLYRIPFVSTDVGNVREIVSPGQLNFLVKPGVPKLFSDALIRLIADSNKDQLIKSNFSIVVSKYTLTHSLKAFTQLFI